MNDEPKRLLDEDPDGAASALLRAALENGPPPPLGAKERVAEELGIDRATITSIKERRMAAWMLSSGIAAAAAVAIWMVLPDRSADEVHQEFERVPTPAFAPDVPRTAAADDSPPSPVALTAERVHPSPMATAAPRQMATVPPTTTALPFNSADAGSPKRGPTIIPLRPYSGGSAAPKSPAAPKNPKF